MTTVDDVRRIALALPSVEVAGTGPGEQLSCTVGGKGFAWTWLQRHEPKEARVPQPAVLAVRTDGQAGKEELLAADPAKFFTEDHYNGYPAVLVRLAAVDVDELTELLTDAWRLKAPHRLVKEYDGA